MVVVQDGGSPPRTATGTVFISVLDDNDNDPSFVHSQSGKKMIIQVMQKLKHETEHDFTDCNICIFGQQVLEGQSSGVLLGTLQAKDPDEGENGTVFYSLSGTVPAGNKICAPQLFKTRVLI